MSNESAETYLRQFAESLLRQVAGGRLTPDECSSRVRAVAAAFEGTGELDAGLADSVHGDVEVALAARSADAGTLMHLGRRAPISVRPGPPGVSRWLARSAGGPGGERNGSHEGSLRGIRVTPVGAVLRVRADATRADRTGDDDGDEDIYLLGFVARPGRAWLAVAARTNERPARRPASPRSSRGAGAKRRTPTTFAGGGMTAVDDAGQRYDLSFSGGGGEWYLGRLTLNPAPPAGLGRLDVRCGTESVRVDLTARARAVAVTTLPLAVGRAEAYLLRRAETLLTRPALATAEAAGMADVVPALRASGALAGDSPVPGQIAALCERLGTPGRVIAMPGRLPERWENFLAATGTRDGTGSGTGAGAEQLTWRTSPADASALDAARLAVALRAGDGIIIVLAGLITGTDGITIIFGGLYLGADPSAAAADADPAMWVRDDAGGWHSVSISGWSSDGNSGVTFQAVVVPPLSPATSEIEFHVTGSHRPAGPQAARQIRAVIPLEWWSAS
jgi:hypothetical protein